MSIYKRDFDKTKCMYLFIEDESFFDKCNEIWEKVSNVIKKKLIVNLYIVKYIKICRSNID